MGCCPCCALGSRPPGPGATCLLGALLYGSIFRALGLTALSSPVSAPWSALSALQLNAQLLPLTQPPSIPRFLRTCSVSGTGVAQIVRLDTDEAGVGSCLFLLIRRDELQDSERGIIFPDSPRTGCPPIPSLYPIICHDPLLKEAPQLLDPWGNRTPQRYNSWCSSLRVMSRNRGESQLTVGGPHLTLSRRTAGQAQCLLSTDRKGI